jgi:beta-fructofuranosidase
MIVGSGVEKVGGCILLYRSKDMKNWEYQHQLTSGSLKGTPTLNPCDDGEMWECPEFFALDGQHVLIYSTMGKVFWQSGILDEPKMKFKTMKTGLLDLDAFYAPKTQLDASGRRILWGWIPERRPPAAMLDAGWSGMMNLPRVMNLDRDGTLRVQVLPQIAMLRSSILAQEQSKASVRSVLHQASGELICVGMRGKSFDFNLTTDSAELMHISYSAEKHAFATNGMEVALEPDDEPTLHAFIDGSVIELIMSQRIGYTKRFYYTGPTTAPDVQAWAHQGRVQMTAWKVIPISQNRHTTPA